MASDDLMEDARGLLRESLAKAMEALAKIDEILACDLHRDNYHDNFLLGLIDQRTQLSETIDRLMRLVVSV